LNHLDLFSGIGGFSLAASWVWGAEHNIIAFCEIDKFCQKVLKKHWPDTVIWDDIKTLNKEILWEIENLNILVNMAKIHKHAQKNVEMNMFCNLVLQIEKNIESITESGVAKNGMKLLTIMELSVFVAEKQYENSLLLIIKTIMELLKEKDTNLSMEIGYQTRTSKRLSDTMF